ncbi:uncharacterized protein [Nicotiana tomentosiformis]|uniref:uncharacterized protein n=1 Tax=Nicotiana tomentosiformis TaxID=4098 RepID=UPI00388C3EE2
MFAPRTRKEELHREFEQLCLGDMTVTRYETRFRNLPHHAVWLVPTERERIRRFIDGLNYGLRYSLTREAETNTRFDQVVEISRCLEQVCMLEREEWEGKRPRGSGGFCGTSFGGQSHCSRGRYFRPTQAAPQIPGGSLVSNSLYSFRPVQSSFSALPAQSLYCVLSVQGLRVPGSSSGYSSSGGPIQASRPFSGRGCYECGELGHVRKYCPCYYRGLVQQGGQTMTPSPLATPPAQPEVVSSDAVITSIISICHRDASVLFDHDSTYSHVSSYFTRYLDTPHDSLDMSVHVSTPVGDSIMVDRVYRLFVVTIGIYETRFDLLLLSMVDFDVILGMD